MSLSMHKPGQSALQLPKILSLPAIPSSGSSRIPKENPLCFRWVPRPKLSCSDLRNKPFTLRIISAARIWKALMISVMTNLGCQLDWLLPAPNMNRKANSSPGILQAFSARLGQLNNLQILHLSSARQPLLDSPEQFLPPSLVIPLLTHVFIFPVLFL